MFKKSIHILKSIVIPSSYYIDYYILKSRISSLHFCTAASSRARIVPFTVSSSCKSCWTCGGWWCPMVRHGAPCCGLQGVGEMPGTRPSLPGAKMARNKSSIFCHQGKRVSHWFLLVFHGCSYFFSKIFPYVWLNLHSLFHIVFLQTQQHSEDQPHLSAGTAGIGTTASPLDSSSGRRQVAGATRGFTTNYGHFFPFPFPFPFPGMKGCLPCSNAVTL